MTENATETTAMMDMSTQPAAASTEEDDGYSLDAGYVVLFVVGGVLTLCLIVACAFVQRQNMRNFNHDQDAGAGAQA